MNQVDIDSFFKEKLFQLESEPNKDSWNKISQKLEASAAIKASTIIKYAGLCLTFASVLGTIIWNFLPEAKQQVIPSSVEQSIPPVASIAYESSNKQIFSNNRTQLQTQQETMTLQEPKTSNSTLSNLNTQTKNLSFDQEKNSFYQMESTDF